MPLFSQGGPLSFTGGFVKLNLLLPPVVAVVLWAIPTFCKSPQAGELLAALPVSVDFAPYFLLTVLVMFHWVVNAVIFTLASMTKEGLDNGNSRLVKREGVLGRLKSASLNGFEANGYAACMVLVGSKLPACGRNVVDPCISPDLFARLTLLFALTRCLYYPLYALDIDYIRSATWLTGFVSLIAIGAAPFFGFTSSLQ